MQAIRASTDKRKMLAQQNTITKEEREKDPEFWVKNKKLLYYNCAYDSSIGYMYI